MALFWYYDGAGIGDLAIRLQTGFALTESAEAGVVATSNVDIDDPSGALSIVGLKTFRMLETACSWPRAFTGYIAERSIGRADSLLTGAARRWSCSVVDANSALNFEVIRGAAANRPAETDIARLTWLLSSGYQGPLVDAGYIDTGSPVDLDACDYRGRYAADVLADCSTTSGKNYFVAYDQTANGLAVHYYAASSSLWTSTLRISNVKADVDQVTTFAPSSDAKLARDPSRVYSGVYLAYGDGESAVYVSDSGTASAFRARDYSTVDTTVNTATGATAKANKLQNQASSEYDRITVSIGPMDAAQVNLLRVGQRVQVKFSHLPSYTSFTYIRVARRTIRQLTTGKYQLDLELANTKAIRGAGGHSPAPNPDGSVVLVSGSALTLTRKEGSRITYQSALSNWSYGVVASPRVQSTVSPNTPYTTCGCPLGAGGWGPGTSDRTIWWEYTPTLGSTDVGILVSVEVPTELLGEAVNGYAFAAINLTGGPGGWGDWQEIAYFKLATGAQVYIPRGLINDATTNYFGIVPGWQANMDAFFCAQDLIDGAGGPVVGGEGASGRTNSFQVTMAYCGIEGTGVGLWVAGVGDVDGTNQDYSLVGWTGTGQVQLMVNGLVQPDEAFSLDRTTLVATTYAPYRPGDVVLWRYRVAT